MCKGEPLIGSQRKEILEIFCNKILKSLISFKNSLFFKIDPFSPSPTKGTDEPQPLHKPNF